MQQKSLQCDKCGHPLDSFLEWKEHFQIHLDGKNLKPERIHFDFEIEAKDRFRIVSIGTYSFNEVRMYVDALNRMITLLHEQAVKE